MSIPVAVIVQARMGGSRFPGKVLQPLLGQPMLLWQLDRLAYMPSAPAIVVATPPTQENRAIWDLCERHGYQHMAPACDEQDVLTRYAEVAEACEAEHIIRVTGDCPLLDPLVVEALWQTYQQTTPAECLRLSEQWPDGQDCDVFPCEALFHAAREAHRPSEREHVTPAIWHMSLQARAMACQFDYSQMQYSVDTPADLAGVERLLALAVQRWPLQWIGYRELGVLVQTDDSLCTWQQHRAARNHKYLTQLAEERDAAYRGPRIHRAP